MAEPVWLTVAAWVYLPACFCCACVIAYDIAVNYRRQPVGMMNVVFPVTALYFGPFALALYWRWGRVARGERARPWCCSFDSDDAPGGSAQVQSWLEARYRLTERDLGDG
jgi:hypothetical protein